MSFARWRPRTDYSKQEQVLRRRLTRTGKLFGFLRDYRSELFNDEFQRELESMYRDSGADAVEQAVKQGRSASSVPILSAPSATFHWSPENASADAANPWTPIVVTVRMQDVLLLGETGVGKERIARLIHESSPRRKGRFVALDSANLSTTLAESELFGHVAGAFTGASQLHKGVFEQAARGTVFIDEVGELPLAQQSKLFRVLQENRLKRVGDEHEISVDARVIAGTNRDLAEMVTTGAFRRELYYRLKVIEIRVPSLRERPDDILPLASHFVARQNAARALRRAARIDLSKEAEEALLANTWPGNVRELEHALEAVGATHRGGSVTVKQLRLPPVDAEGFEAGDGTKTLKELVKAFEVGVIKEAIAKHGSQKAAAPHLGISQQAISVKLR